MASPRARRLRKNPTETESRFWMALRQRQICGAKFRRQVPLGPYVADFVCHEAKLVIEVDGGQHAWQAGAGAKRDACFAARGYRVLRFWNNEVFENLEGVVGVVAQALKGSPHPGPPPQGGREI